MPISCSRETPRASSNPPRLAHATARMSSTSTPTADIIVTVSFCRIWIVAAGVGANVLLVPDVLRILLAQLIGQPQQLLLGCFGRRSGSQPSPHLQIAARSGRSQRRVALQKVRYLLQRHPQIRMGVSERRQRIRRHADYRSRLPVDMDHPADYAWVAPITLLPQSIAQHYRRRRVLRVCRPSPDRSGVPTQAACPVPESSCR